MVSLLIAALAFQAPTATAQTATKSVTASGLISTMLSHYTSAKTIVGTVNMVQEASGRTITTDSELEYERPNKIYLRQAEHSSEGRTFLLTSDGKTFSYDRPPERLGHESRYVEYTHNEYKQLDLGGIYTATLQSIVDPNHMLNIAIGRKGDLERFAAQLSNFRISDHATSDGVTTYRITGKYSLAPNAEATADFTMDLTTDGDFRLFAVRQMYGIPKHPEMPPIAVTTTWKSTLKVDAQPDPSLFKTVK